MPQLEVSPNPFTDAFIIEVKEATVVSHVQRPW
jgi:cell division protein FtsX